jgi:DNA-binding GntR family transcriptional regulator
MSSAIILTTRIRMETPIQREILRDKIFDVLKTWILDGTLTPGERIVESTIARQLQVSRAPLREALWLLANVGLVQLKAHQGAFVARLSQQDIKEIFEVRQTLETHAAKKVRATLTPDSKIRLENAMTALENAARVRDVARCTNADMDFHRTICELSGNRHLTEILNDISTRFFAYELIRDLRNPGSYQFDEKVAEHRELLGLILNGTDRAIEAGFRELFARFLNHVLTRLQEEAGVAPVTAVDPSAN